MRDSHFVTPVVLFAFFVRIPGVESKDDVISTPRPPRLSFDVEDRLNPGLTGSYASTRDDATERRDVRVLRLAALFVPRETAPTPFLPAGPFSVRLRGYLFLDLRGTYTFHWSGQGSACLRVNDTPIMEGKGNLSHISASTAALHGGYNSFDLNYESPERRDAVLRVSWEARPEHFPRDQAFGVEPLPPIQLMHDPENTQLQLCKQRRRGRELFAAHRCGRCHQVAGWSSPFALPEMQYDRLSLQNAGQRFRPEWMYAWMRQPRALRNHVSMPSLLSHLDAARAQEVARDISAFLASLGAATTTHVRAADEAAAVETGERVFEHLGCVACHRFTPPAEPDDFDRTSLYFAGAKYRSGALESFLRHPHAHHPLRRMPDFSLTPEESRALGAYVRDRAQGQLPTDVNWRDSDPRRGRELFHTHRCDDCHTLDGSERRQTQKLALTLALPTPGGCLGPDGPKTIRAPNFHLSPSDRQALIAFLRLDGHSSGHEDLAYGATRIAKSLNCKACHRRDGEPSVLLDVLQEESVTGSTPQRVPSLTWTGEKLRSDWMERLFAGKLGYRSRPWLRARMPAFPVWALLLAKGLPAEHGYSAKVRPRPAFDPQKAEVGNDLSIQNGGFFCIECHAVGKQPPVGAFAHRGVSFNRAATRIQYDFYHRWIMNPLRVDTASKMPRFSPDGKTTRIKRVYEGDARLQFEALWHYLQSKQTVEAME